MQLKTREALDLNAGDIIHIGTDAAGRLMRGTVDDVYDALLAANKVIVELEELSWPLIVGADELVVVETPGR